MKRGRVVCRFLFSLVYTLNRCKEVVHIRGQQARMRVMDSILFSILVGITCGPTSSWGWVMGSNSHHRMMRCNPWGWRVFCLWLCFGYLDTRASIVLVAKLMWQRVEASWSSLFWVPYAHINVDYVARVLETQPNQHQVEGVASHVKATSWTSKKCELTEQSKTHSLVQTCVHVCAARE